MGKKTRKTRWRTLNIDEQSDSEESTTATSGHQTKPYQQKSYYKFPYSSQSTPTRRYPQDVKSTRSSSTASENKVTFNEDEYTRITTPRQDVLFKKGYLNKPKTYQTQTSTGTSATSTSNSTGNGTPDHQSADGAEGTDLEYESQFVFPNGFIDQNGICYINSFEPYPLVVYNTICYPEFPNNGNNPRSKRHSTGSLTESTSPNNEENSQSGGEGGGTGDFAPQVYNVVYPGYYYGNGTCSAEDSSAVDQRRIKKKRRRKISKTQTEDTDDGHTSNDETAAPTQPEVAQPQPETTSEPPSSPTEPPQSSEEATPTHKPQDTSPPEPQPATEDHCKLKPDAEEFIPRAYRPLEQQQQPVAYVNVPPNFVPIPIVAELPPPPFLPPGIPVNFLPPPPPATNFVNYGHKYVVPVEERPAVVEEVVEVVHQVTPNNEKKPAVGIDIEKIVSKLEEAAKEQNMPVRRRFQGGGGSGRFRQKFERRRKVEVAEVVEAPKREQKSFVKKPVQHQKRCPKLERSQPEVKVVEEKKVEVVAVKSASSWIPVSRKKRKNKAEEEVVEVEKIVDQEDQFESYDVDLLVDVVPEEVAIVPEVVEVPEESVVPEVVVVVPEEVSLPKEEETLIKVEEKPKKPKKKPQPKRLLITDVFPEEPEIEQPPPQPQQPKPELQPKPQPEPKQQQQQQQPTNNSTEKKSKKKRKKPLTKTLSVSSSSTTINLDDSYDFLLDTTVLEDSEDKTNVEISQELDRMIQKSIYTNLEEKIKSIDSTAFNDTFFKTLTISPTASTGLFEKNSFFRPADFSAFIKKPEQIFLENPKVEEILNQPQPEPEKKYPITQAVKEWMTKTRETTPEVEILKSPGTILRELKNGQKLAEEEETLFVLAEDLLECWDNDLRCTEIVEEKIEAKAGEEEELEVYESKYGQNEDFLRLQKEVEETRRLNHIPRHNNLPYRAICCSVM